MTTKKSDTAQTKRTLQDTSLLENRLRALRLPTILSEYSKVAKQCAHDDASYEAYLEELAGLETAKRDNNAIQRRIQAAKLPAHKEIADFQFIAIPKLNKAKVIELTRCEYITTRTNVVMVGPPGVGKSHLATGLTLCACRQGYHARFFTAAEIVNTYRESREAKTIMRLEASLKRLDMIVIDELGYLPVDRIGAENLFGFFSLCYEQVSLIVTTNLPFAQWPQTFSGDERLTCALLDRLTHRVEILSIAGNSYRLQQSQKANPQCPKN
jgi:DNA replication protein DnaC